MMNQMNNGSMIQQFIEFRNNFTGNPQAEVMKMINQGKISQKQLDELQNMATQFQKLMSGIR